MKRMSVRRAKAVGAAAIGVAWSLAQAQTAPSLSIVSPANGTASAPGQLITVQVAVTPGSNFQAVLIEGEGMVASAPRTTPPYTFTLTVPSNVIGTRQITAFGITAPGAGVQSKSISIDSESAETVVSLDAHIDAIPFRYAGEQFPLYVVGMTSTEGPLDLTNSAKISYVSTNPAVVSVTPAGLITAVGTGSGSVNIKYGTVAVSVKISVPANIRGDFNGDGHVDKDDLNFILAALNTPANGPNDARDLNHDGVINALDARILVTLCTKPGCATH